MNARAAIWHYLPRWARDGAGLVQARRAGEKAPAPPRVAREDTRLLIGPANFAGQGAAWARAVGARPLTSAVAMVTGTGNSFSFAADWVVPNRISAHSRRWQRETLDWIARTFTHVLIEAELRILGGAFGGDVVRQVGALRERGVNVAMVAHGTDVRLPSRHAVNEPWSPFRTGWPDLDKVEAGVRHNLGVLREVDAPTFVSTAGLLADVPAATVLPVTISTDRWVRAGARNLGDATGRLIVAHIPSSGRIKGTREIAPVLEELDAQGIIDYRPATGVSHGAMPGLYGAADVVVDQFLVGDYGVAACEAMAAGRVVVGHVSEAVRGYVCETTGKELPIVEASVDSLREVLVGIAAQRDLHRVRAAQAGPAFVEGYHTGRGARAALESWLSAAP
ncbi:glycosyltransferase [Rarobacter incanus]|uniref:Glycosyltransferase involved in cell wall biosynthesis n=1 Tax=Rarobacter incanus TaxID=153494 RepID=A0A542SNL7_9MICO|nr:glycosyltransferase family 4 protein [Rarobacter incanus]TQK76236.1 hypothetical protein FB389_0896 [Rarobacter incanus]